MKTNAVRSRSVASGRRAPRGDKLVTAIAQMLEQELERRRSRLWLLAEGAAFEAWLGFETRLLIEERRAALNLDAQRTKKNGRTVNQFWVANEYRKVDLLVGDRRHETLPFLFGIEFKLIHNNKNWKAQVRRVWRDLDAARPEKTALSPRFGWYALVAHVGKVYRDDAGVDYPGQARDLVAWSAQVQAELCPPGHREGQRVKSIWSGRRIPIRSGLYATGHEHFFQLQVVAPA